MKHSWKSLAFGSMIALAVSLGGCGDDKKPEPAKPAAKPAAQAPAPKAAAPAKQERVRLYTDEQLSKMSPQERAQANRKEYRANLSPEELRADLITDKPEHKKFEKMVAEKYPVLTNGAVDWKVKGVAVPGEVIYGYHRVIASNKAPKFKLDNGMEIRGRENYDIEVLYGACKGQCVIEATETHTSRMNAEQTKKPLIETGVIVPFDKTYVRHEENGKKWVTHEKCGTK